MRGTITAPWAWGQFSVLCGFSAVRKGDATCSAEIRLGPMTVSASDLNLIAEPVLKLLAIVGGTVLLWSALGFILALPLLFIIARKGVLKRKHTWWNRLTLLVYPYLLLAFMASAGAWGALTASHHEVDTRIDDTLGPLVRAQLPTMKEWLTTQVEWDPNKDYSLEEAAQNVLAKLHYPPKDDSWWEQQRARAVNYVTMNTGKWVIAAGLGAAISYGMGRAGESLGLDKDTVRFSIDVIREMDLSRLDDNFFQILERALHDKVAKVFKALNIKVGLFSLAALLVPVAEMLVYFYWYERKVLGPPPAEASA